MGTLGTPFSRLENYVVQPLKPVFYKRYVNDIYSRRKKNCTDQLYHKRNNYLPNTNLTVKINPKKFLDTQVITKNGKIEIAVYRKVTKLPVPWPSNFILKFYKRNAINADLIN